MKKLLVAGLAVLTIGGSFAQTTYKVDTAASKVTYVGKKVTGEHTGNVTIKSGNIVLGKDDTLKGGEIVVDMNSLTSTDITDKDYNAKYVGHMKSADFFNTEKFPESKLLIKSSKKTEKGLEVNGDLTMLGETKPITFVIAELKKTASELSGKSTLVLDRTVWGLKYGSDSFFKGLGDKAIKNEFNLTVDLTAKK